MLLDFREKVRNSKPLKYSLITLICIPFVLVGIGSYFSGGTAPPVAEVNGQPIDQQQLEGEYRRQRQQLAQMFGGQIPEAFANESLLREQALQELITRQVMVSEVEEQKFAIGDRTLARAIRSEPAFQQDGSFDQSAYLSQVARSGLSVQLFERSFRDSAALNQFRAGISDTAFTLPQEADQLAALGRQLRTVDAVRFDFAQAKESIDVTDEDITAFFEQNQDNYLFPERAKIEYIELDSNNVASGIQISDQQAQTYYEENRARYVVPGQREASHILLEAGDESEADQIVKLLELKARAEAGESFAELATEFSDDVGSASNGGSLGVIGRGVMVPEFEEAVFAMDTEGSLSEPVVSQFGVHLIRLDKITPEVETPFEEVKDEIIATLQQNEADREFFDLRDLLVELSFDNPGSLEPTADATGLEIKTSDWLDSETDSGPVLSNGAVMSAIFSPEVLDDGNNSDLVELDNRHVLVLRVIEHEDPRPKTLDDVREEVVDTLTGERAREMLDAKVEDAVEKLASGMEASEIAGDDELASALSQEVLDRQSTVFDRRVIGQIFALPYPNDSAITDTAELANGDALAIRLDKVEIPEADSPDSESEITPTVAGVLPPGNNPRAGMMEFNAVLESLRSKADVEVMGAEGS